MEIPLISGRDYPNTYRSFTDITGANSCGALTDYPLKKNPKAGYMRPLGFLFSDSDKRGGVAIFGVEIASAETISER